MPYTCFVMFFFFFSFVLFIFHIIIFLRGFLNLNKFESEFIKNLGVTITFDLNWNSDIGNIGKPAKRASLHVLEMLRNLLRWAGTSSPRVYVYGVDPRGFVLQKGLRKVRNRTACFVSGNYNHKTWSMTEMLEKYLSDKENKHIL